jgi:hypothetical protein
MDRRLDDAAVQGIGIRDDTIAQLAGQDPVAMRSTNHLWTPLVVVRNRAARARGGVAVVEIKEFLADIPVGPGSAAAPVRRAAPQSMPTLGVSTTQLLDRRIGFDQLESPQHYPDKDLVSVTRAAVWVEPIAGYGLRGYSLGSAISVGKRPRPVNITEGSLDNGIVRLAVSTAGRVSVSTADGKRGIDDLLRIEDRVDRGDLYTPSIRETAAVPELVGVAVTKRGPLIGELRVRWRLREQADAGARPRPTTLTIRFALIAESGLVRLAVSGRNRRRDHRLRLGLRTDIANGEVWADAAFGPVRRVPLQVPDDDARDEMPPPTAPLHRYVSLFGRQHGATIVSDGLAECEATQGGEVLVTLLRAVGALSRNDLPERPGHAGWPAPTPKAQSLGAFGANLALLLHGPRTTNSIDVIEHAADDALLPLEGRTIRASRQRPLESLGVEIRGAGLAFSTVKESEDGDWLVARCVNLGESSVEGAWRFGVPIREARLARLDETPRERLAIAGDTVSFHAPPRAVSTILVR